MITRQRIVQTARQFIDTPFVPQGRLPGIGLDCVGLIAMIAKFHHLDFEDRQHYSIQDWTGDKLLTEVKKNFDPLAKLDNGCILLLWFRRPHLPQHFAVYTEDGTIIHTEENTGRVVEIQYDESWRKRTHSIWKFKELNNEW